MTGYTSRRRSRWFSGRALLLHLAAVVVIGGCGGAFWWQLHRAIGGNELSWAYTFEWPFFAVFGAVVWWQQIHDDPENVGRRALERARAQRQAGAGSREAGSSDGDEAGWAGHDADPDLAAYNRYLADLASSGRRKSWRRT